MNAHLSPVDPAAGHRSDPQSLSSLLGDAPIGWAVRDIARSLAARHAGAQDEPRPGSAASPESLWEQWQGHLEVLAGAQHTALDPVRIARISWLAQRYLAGRAPLFVLRATAGGSGGGLDNLTSRLPPPAEGPGATGVAIAAPSLDPLVDVASVAVELESRGHTILVAALCDAYREFSGDIFPASIVHHYAALEAAARASKALRSGSGNSEAPERARRLVLLAVRHLDLGRPHLVLVGGEPGTGKSTIAAKLVDACGWMLLTSSQIRSETVGGSPPLVVRVEPLSGPHEPATTLAAYTEVLRRAGLLLERGESAIVDATWSQSSWRDQAASVAAAAFAELVSLRCDAGETIRDARIRRRIAAGPAIADAAVDISRGIAARFQPWPEATTVDTRPPIWRSLATALHAIGTQESTMTPAALDDDLGPDSIAVGHTLGR